MHVKRSIANIYTHSMSATMTSMNALCASFDKSECKENSSICKVKKGKGKGKKGSRCVAKASPNPPSKPPTKKGKGKGKH